MPKRLHARPNLGGEMVLNPDPVQAGVPTVVHVTGTNCPDGPIQLGFRGEYNPVSNVGVIASATVVGGAFEADLPERAYVGPNPLTDPEDFPVAEMDLEAWAPGSGQTTAGGPGSQPPPLIAVTTLEILR